MITDVNLIKLFIEKVKESTGIDDITPEEAMHVSSIPLSPNHKSYTILSIQRGDMTILARLHISKTGNVEIKDVRTQTWQR